MTMDAYLPDDAEGDSWRLMLGDSCERLAEIEDESVGLSVYSPPFASLFTYSPSPRDLGNCSDRQEFLDHYAFVIAEMLRVTMPGRLSCVHVQQLSTTKATHGVIGLTDFRGQVIAAHEREGWTYYGEVTVDKCPQALRNGTPVLTPAGWVAIDDLVVGDSVIGSDGMPTKVVGVWPHQRKQLYRVTFSDGASIDCCADHLWNVRGLGARRSGRWRTMRTDELYTRGALSPSGRRRWEIPLVEPIHGEDGDLPLDGYTLGALLGDGNITQRASVSICSQHEVVDGCGLPAAHSWRRQEGTDKGAGSVAVYHAVCDEWHRNDVLSALRMFGLQGRRAWEKFVPAAYLFASPATRLAVLRGIMDADGRMSAKGTAVLRVTSSQLASDVAYLARSLGGVARLRHSAAPKYEYNGERRTGRPQFAVSINLPMCPFTIAKKADRWRPDRRSPHREIASIEPVDVADATCITVESEDGLFVCDEVVVTHNSQAIRTKAHCLMFQTLKRDSSGTRPALADYVLLFRKPGENPVPIKNDVDNETWIQWARPVWYDIRESDTLNFRSAREDGDEKHICPLQLPLIERCVRLWSNPGELVCSPFAGIGSEGVVSLRKGRRFVGCELKASYWRTAVNNLRAEEAQPSLFADA